MNNLEKEMLMVSQMFLMAVVVNSDLKHTSDLILVSTAVAVIKNILVSNGHAHVFSEKGESSFFTKEAVDSISELASALAKVINDGLESKTISGLESMEDVVDNFFKDVSKPILN